MPPEQLVSEFIGPNMTWLNDWSVELLQKGALPPKSRLPERVKKRLLWQAHSEMTYLKPSRSNARTHWQSCSCRTAWLHSLVQTLLSEFEEEFRLQRLTMRQLWRNGYGGRRHTCAVKVLVMHPELTNYAADGNVYRLQMSGGRKEWMRP
jgi:DEAD/DEAH box helicase domain-containing protein